MTKEASIEGFIGSVVDTASGVGQAVYNGFYPPNSPEAQRQVTAINNAANNAIKRDAGHDILAAGAGGLGLGILATRLHHILSNLNKPDEKYTKFAPGAHAVDDDEKIGSVGDAAADAVGGAALSIAAPAEYSPGSDKVNWSDAQQAWLTPLVFGTSIGGLVLGHKLMAGLQAKKKKEQLKDTVVDAKKEYERALLGKRGSDALDSAFEKLAEGGLGAAAASAAKATLLAPWAALNAVPIARELYWTGLLGSGLAAGKMTYDWTRERSRDKAIERAQKARARMAGNQPVYVDPEQLVAVKKLIEK